jgi:Gas vesicle synthesis protein GvpL/GvpF
VTPSSVLPVSDSATYVFCLVQSARAPSLRGAPASVPGAGPPRVIPVERGVWAVVADAPLDRFSGERLQSDLHDLEVVSRHAVAHATVVEFFFRASPVIPLKLLTLFSSDERLRAHLLARKAGLRRLFAELRGFEEWGVRVTAGEAMADAARSLKSGADYLATKKRLKDEATAPPRSTIREAHGALKALARLAARTRKEAFPPPGRGRPFVTGASYLVKAGRRKQWKQEVARIARRLEEHGHRLDVSGPWPPYHFASR